MQIQINKHHFRDSIASLRFSLYSCVLQLVVCESRMFTIHVLSEKFQQSEQDRVLCKNTCMTIVV